MRSDILAIALCALLTVSLLTALSQATPASVTGVETITATPNVIALKPGSIGYVNFTLNLTSGYYAYGTQLLIQNLSYFVQHHIFVALRTTANQTFGNPNMSGVVHIDPAYNTTPGSYRINLTGTSQGVQIVPATIELLVTPNTTTTTLTTTTTSTASTTSSVAPTTTAKQGQTTASTTSVGAVAAKGGGSGLPGNPPYYEIAGVAVVVILVITFLLRSRGAGKDVMPKPAKQKPQDPNAGNGGGSATQGQQDN